MRLQLKSISCKNFGAVLTELQQIVAVLLAADKSHFLALGDSRDEPVTIKIGNASVQNSTQEKLLGILKTIS